MARTFSITTTANRLDLGQERRGEVVYTVSNAGERRVQARAMVWTRAPAQRAWYSLAGEPERDLPPSGTHSFLVRVAVPRDAPEGEVVLRLDVMDVEHPDETYTEGQAVTVAIPRLPLGERIEDYAGVWINLDPDTDPARVAIHEEEEAIEVDMAPPGPFGLAQTRVALLVGARLNTIALPGAPRISFTRDEAHLVAEIVTPHPTPIAPDLTVHRRYNRRPSATVEDFLGAWVNADPRARRLSRVGVDQRGGLWVHLFDRVGSGPFAVPRERMSGAFKNRPPPGLIDMWRGGGPPVSEVRDVDWGVICAQNADRSQQAILSRVGKQLLVSVMHAGGDPPFEWATLDPAPRAWLRVGEER